jgi:hypothetical protein
MSLFNNSLSLENQGAVKMLIFSLLQSVIPACRESLIVSFPLVGNPSSRKEGFWTSQNDKDGHFRSKTGGVVDPVGQASRLSEH